MSKTVDNMERRWIALRAASNAFDPVSSLHLLSSKHIVLLIRGRQRACSEPWVNIPFVRQQAQDASTSTQGLGT